MENDNEKTSVMKGRILAAAVTLFSQHGFDGTSVSEIAKLAGVNKALIYYYFESKNAILESLFEELLHRIQAIAANFSNNRTNMLYDSAMPELIRDKLVFSDIQARERFLGLANAFYETLVDSLIEDRELVRILMIESLKYGSDDKHMFKIASVQPDFFCGPGMERVVGRLMDSYGSTKTRFYLFFISMIPALNFAAFFDKFCTIYGFEEKRLIREFLMINGLQLRSLIEWNSRIAGQNA